MEKKKILIIDDTVDTVDLLVKRFNNDGYETLKAFDGEQGLEMVKQHGPDLIILDVMMPKLDGFQVCMMLKQSERTRFIPVLMLTAKSDLPDKIKGLDLGADDYLTKPFDYHELLARVKSLLAKKEASEKQAAEEKTEALDHLVDEVAHEVRNPLVTIGGFARRIHNSLPSGDKNKEYLQIILQNVVSLEKMVDQLIDLKSAVFSYVEPTNMNELLEDILDNYQRQFKEKAINVRKDLMKNPPLIPADQENIRKALANIIENAIEAMDDAERVLTVATRNVEGYFEIEVVDTGKGISKDKIKCIYDPFYTSKTYGPGLGLTFAKKTIQNHKGMITVTSKKGVGTSFMILLPCERYSGEHVGTS